MDVSKLRKFSQTNYFQLEILQNHHQNIDNLSVEKSVYVIK